MRRIRESSALSPPRTEAVLNRAKQVSDSGRSWWSESSNLLGLTQPARVILVPMRVAFCLVLCCLLPAQDLSRLTARLVLVKTQEALSPTQYAEIASDAFDWVDQANEGGERGRPNKSRSGRDGFDPSRYFRGCDGPAVCQDFSTTFRRTTLCHRISR